MKEYQMSRELICISKEGAIFIDAVIDCEEGILWATKKSIAKAFNVKPTVITHHLEKIFSDDELDENSVISDNKYETLYNIDVIISLAYRIDSKNAKQFRIWATRNLSEVIFRGFVLNQEFLKNNSHVGHDYFTFLKEQIEEIRLSKRNFCEKLTDLYATSFDYNPDSQITKEFYTKVLNELQYPIFGLNSLQGMDLTENQLSKIDAVVDLCIFHGISKALDEIIIVMEDWYKILNNVLKFVVNHIYDGDEDIDQKSIAEFIKKEFNNINPINNGFNDNFHELENATKKLISY